MPRDVLLVLLAAGVLLNLALFVIVWLMQQRAPAALPPRRTVARAAPRGVSAPGPTTLPRAMAAAPRIAGPAPWPHGLASPPRREARRSPERSVRPSGRDMAHPAATSVASLRPAESPPTPDRTPEPDPPAGPEPPVRRRAPRPASAATSAKPSTGSSRAKPPVDKPRQETVGKAPPDAARSARPAVPSTRTAAAAARPKSARGRPRRFTMPDREDHRDRTGKAIAAFLGEPVAQKAGPPAQRRRHRARRPNGDSGSRTGVVLALGGGSTPPRVVRAVASALRDTVRESDEIVELTGGRIRISLESDDAGSEAFVARARTIVSPWLELLGPDLELRLEPPGSLPSRTSAAS